MRRESPTRWVRALLGLAVVLLAVRVFRQHTLDITLRPVVWRLAVGQLAASFGWVVLSYACMIWSWRAISRGWRQPVGVTAAARAWAATNIARYFPTHGQSVSRMSAVAEAAGVSRDFAVGAALLPRLVLLACAAAVASGLFVLNQLDAGAPLIVGACLLVAGSLAATVLLTSSDVIWRLGMAIRRPDAVKPVEPDALGFAIIGDVAAFLAQGLALHALILGMMTGIDLSWWAATGSLTAAYAVGRMIPLLPSGVGVREAVLFLLLMGTVGTAPAIAIAVGWRVVQTVTEVAVALLFHATRGA